MEDIIKEFFSKEYETKVNKDILYYNFSEEDVKKYIKKIINVPITTYLAFMDCLSETELITAKDVIQFSNFKDATFNICDKLNKANNPGMKFLEMGKILLDNCERKQGAFIKYGENHAKTAEVLGLVFELCHTYYLSGVGYIYIDLNTEEKERLILRLLLRNKLIQRMYQASKNGNVDAREFFYMISDSTYVRRRSNIKKFLEILKQTNEYDFCEFVDLIKF